MIVLLIMLSLLTLLLLVFAGMNAIDGERPAFMACFLIGFLMFALSLSVASEIGSNSSLGYFNQAEAALGTGDVYTLMTSSEKDGDKFYAMIKTDRGKIIAVYFKEPPAKRAVVVKDNDGKVIFMPVELEKSDR